MNTFKTLEKHLQHTYTYTKVEFSLKRDFLQGFY